MNMDEKTVKIRQDIQTGKIDINNQQAFFKNLMRALITKLNSQFTCRGTSIPHYILNSGDDIMYLENKGQNASIEPYEVSNENYIYTTIPRCIINPEGIEFLGDQLTSPYSFGQFQYSSENGDLIQFSAEFRRMPFKMTVELKYYFDTMTDVFEYVQQVFSRTLSIQTFQFQYLGQTITSSYQVPTGYNPEVNITFDGATTDSKYRVLSISLEVESNFPYYNNRTVVENSNTISIYTNALKIYKDDSTRIEETQKFEHTADVDKLKVLYEEGIPLEDVLEPDLYQKVIEGEPTPEPQPPFADFNFEIYGRTVILYNKSKDYVDCTWNIPNTLSENIYFLTPDMIKVEFRSAGTYIVKLTAKKPGYASSTCEKEVKID